MSDIKITDDQAKRLLQAIRELEEPIVPLSSAEVTEIEAAYDGHQIDPERDARRRAAFEEMLQEYLDDLDHAIGTEGEKDICAACDRPIVNTGQGFWDHVDNDNPGHPAMPKNSSGVVLQYHDAPEDEPDDVSPALEHHTAAMLNILALKGADPNLLEATGYQMRQLWQMVLRTIGHA